MNNNEFKINEYETFEDGANQLSGNANSIETTLDNINKTVETLFSEDIFSGPIANSIKEDWDSQTLTLKNSITDLSSNVGTGLKEIGDNYRLADVSNSNEITEV